MGEKTPKKPNKMYHCIFMCDTHDSARLNNYSTYITIVARLWGSMNWNFICCRFSKQRKLKAKHLTKWFYYESTCRQELGNLNLSLVYVDANYRVEIYDFILDLTRNHANCDKCKYRCLAGIDFESLSLSPIRYWSIRQKPNNMSYLIFQHH
jgi:hypothetical protein